MTARNFEYKKQILEHHLDTFGHVNNARYLDLYEEARWDFISKYGYGLKDIMEKKQGPVILEVTCKYRRELVNRETITIVSTTAANKGKIMTISQQMLKENGDLASEATFTIGFMDLEKRKLIVPPDSWLEATGAK
jgi:YbgC/YbaW family acyl-CoA thioester hydrolase